jgi:hypothetical protein
MINGKKTKTPKKVKCPNVMGQEKLEITLTRSAKGLDKLICF